MPLPKKDRYWAAAGAVLALASVALIFAPWVSAVKGLTDRSPRPGSTGLSSRLVLAWPRMEGIFLKVVDKRSSYDR